MTRWHAHRLKFRLLLKELHGVRTCQTKNPVVSEVSIVCQTPTSILTVQRQRSPFADQLSKAHACSLTRSLARSSAQEGRRSTETCPKGAKRLVSCDGAPNRPPIRFCFEIGDSLPFVNGDAPECVRRPSLFSSSSPVASDPLPTLLRHFVE